jgi:putative transposase
MSQHSYTRCWLHLIWATLRREKTLHSQAAKRVSDYLYQYSKERQIFMKKNFVNADHVHAVIDLPTNYSIEEIIKLLKGSSSHWINLEKLLPGKFSWGRGYAAFSVSHSNLKNVLEYIGNQAEHHRVKSFSEEYEEFIRRHGLVGYKDD